MQPDMFTSTPGCHPRLRLSVTHVPAGCLVHKCVHSQAPAYLTDYCRQTSARRCVMRSSCATCQEGPRVNCTCSSFAGHVSATCSLGSISVLRQIQGTAADSPLCLTAAVLVCLNWRLISVLIYM